MTAAEKLQRIYEALQERGEPGTPYQVARLLQVSPSTVARWEKGGATPQGKTAMSLDLLYRTVVRAEKGDDDARKILTAILGAAGAGLLGLGMGGVLIAAGLGWILGGNDEEGEQ